jgi:cytochrome c oxidase cbb3-type subunit 3
MSTIYNLIKKTIRRSVILIALILPGNLLLAQEEGTSVSMEYFDPLNYLVAFTIIILLVAIIVMAKVINGLVNSEAGAPKRIEKPQKEDTKSQSAKLSWWQKLDRKLTDAVPLEKEADVMLDHEYDGIRELDNSLPPWWKYGFYLTIVFGVIYMLHYHVIGSGKLQLEEYEDQLALAETEQQERLKEVAALVDENTVMIMDDEMALNEGKSIFIEKCAVCHGNLGEGGVGPNMTDEYWIHGGSINDIFKVIKYGVPQKGMIAWQAQITPVDMQKLSSYIITLAGTNPPNSKEPQGELYVPEKDDAAEAADSTQVLSDSTSVAQVMDN